MHFDIQSTTGPVEYVSNGVFTSPVDGIFSCQVYSMTTENGTVFLDITHNDVILASIYGHNTNGITSGGNAVVLHLARHDKLQVKTRANQVVSIFDYYVYALANTFTCSQVGSNSLSMLKFYLIQSFGSTNILQQLNKRIRNVRMHILLFKLPLV